MPSTLARLEAHEVNSKAVKLALVAFLGDLRVSLFDVPVAVEREVFFITFHQQLQPLFTLNAGNVDGAVVTLRKAFRRDVFVERISVSSVENDSIAEFLAQEWLEQCEDHLEDLRLVHDVNRFDPKRH